MKSAALPLAGVGVLVTRAEHQAGNLAERIRRLGGDPILFPALAIEMLPQVTVDAGRLGQFDYAIFVSPNAARIAMALIRGAGGLPPGMRVAAIGPSTAAELGKSGLKNDGSRTIITGPEGFDSEALLESLPAEQVSGKRIAIFRGQGGREFLGRALRLRGAVVEYFECYRRVRPEGDMQALLPRWQQGIIGASVATSGQIVANLFEMAGEAGRRWLCNAPMFVPHPRVAAAAFQRGARALVVAGAGDEALVAGLETWFGRSRPEYAVKPAS